MDGLADFTTVTAGPGVAVTVALLVSVTGPPVGGVPDAVAVLLTDPASMSAWVTALVAVQVVDAAGAKLDTGHETGDRPGNGSETPTALSVTFPVFVTTKLYVTV